MRYTTIALWIIVVCAWLNYALRDDYILIPIIVTAFAATSTFAAMAGNENRRNTPE